MTRTRTRIVAICTLLAVLAGLFVWAGTVQPDPANNDFPDGEDLLDDPDQYVGDRISVSGTVVATDPLTIEAEPAPGRTITFVIEDVDRGPAVGDDLRVFGVLHENDRVEAIETVHREPWERHYMYVVSFLGGLVVLARLLNRWTLDADEWAVVPRETPVVTLPGGDRDA